MKLGCCSAELFGSQVSQEQPRRISDDSMSGQLSLLTPITSPMVTRPPSPAALAGRKAFFNEESFPTDPAVAPDAAALAVAAAEEGLLAAGAAPATVSSSAGGVTSPAQHSINNTVTETGTGSSVVSPARSKKWKSPPCCDGCGAAKASGGQCAGCNGRFCAACMGVPAGMAAARMSPAGSTSSSPRSASSSTGGCADKDPCGNCSSLCNACKPVACCFCEEVRQQDAASRMCETCAGVCDACQKAACGLCRAEFSSCSNCGFAACEDCRLQLQLQYGAAGSGGMGALVGPSGAASCWCAPPLRMASNVRHVSSQRFQMAQLHPSFLACSMEAAGLRDADYDDDNDVNYEEDDVIMGHMLGDAADPDPDTHDQHVSSAANNSLGGRTHGQGLTGLLCTKTMEAAIGSLPGVGAAISLPLSPSSSHSSHSLGHYGAAGGHFGHGLAGVLGYTGGLRHPEHTLRGWLDGGS